MTVDTTWLRCPNCFQELEPVGGRTIGCADGHRFDESRHGYVTLLPPKAPRTIGDDREMLDARSAFLATGAYRAIAGTVADLAAIDVRAREDGRSVARVADLGCGTGYYSAAVAERLGAADVLAADRSPDAVRASSRALRSLSPSVDASTGLSTGAAPTGVVLDLWRPLPLRDGTADVVLDIFAPRNPAEFARILAAEGRLIVVVPTGRHLAELRADGSMLEIPEGKDDHVVGQFAAASLVVLERRRLEYTIVVDAASRAHLVGMGPSAHHRAADAGTASGAETSEHVGNEAPAGSPITVSVDVLAFGHR